MLVNKKNEKEIKQVISLLEQALDKLEFVEITGSEYETLCNTINVFENKLPTNNTKQSEQYDKAKKYRQLEFDFKPIETKEIKVNTKRLQHLDLVK